jgi:glycine betaine/proline transport system substrate-binding protein
MLAIQNGEKPDAAADTWIAAHGDRVNTWVAAQ